MNRFVGFRVQWRWCHPLRLPTRAAAFLPAALIVIVATLAYLPALQSGDRINQNADFFQYASRHEAVRKSLVELGTFPLRSHWLGGGFPTIGDPEDPTFNPLIVFTLVFGTVYGLKLIVYLSLLVGGLATYALARYLLGYTMWGALYAGLIYGNCLFIPMRIKSGNYNEVCAAFLPLGLLLLGFACRGRKLAIAIMPLLFAAMLSDGKLTCLMALLFIGVLCGLDLVPGSAALGTADAPRVSSRRLKIFMLAIGLTVLVGAVRILPAVELIHENGGITQLLAALPKEYNPTEINAIPFDQLWKEAAGLGGRTGLPTVGWMPVLLAVLSLIMFPRNLMAWAVALVLSAWLAMAHYAPLDLLKLLWRLPVFEAIHSPDKYFTFQIAFVLSIASGRCFSLLRRFHSRWIEGLVAAGLIGVSLWTILPSAAALHRDTYQWEASVVDAPTGGSFFHIKSDGGGAARSKPPRSLAFYNLRCGIGTLDWYTGIPLPAYAIVKYRVGNDNEYQLNPRYRGEAFFAEETGGNTVTSTPVFRPNSITISVDVRAPGVLLINQNFHRDWYADRGSLVDQDGLLALRLNTVGRYTIHMRYHPRSFYAGLAVSLVSLCGLMFVGWAISTGRLQRWSEVAPKALRRGSRAIQWLVA